MTRIVVHDYGGYGFPLQLSRTLADRGHEVLHLTPAGFRNPKTRMARRSGDPPTLVIDAIDLAEPPRRDQFVRRLMQERRYGQLLAHRISFFSPQVVLSANTPLSAQAAALTATKRAGAQFVFWVQDLYSVAMRQLIGRRTRLTGAIVGVRFERLEQRLLLASDAVILITEAFLPRLAQWRIPQQRISVIENWAALDEIVPTPKVNSWSTEQGIARARVLLYAGTLGRKHDPTLLLSLAQAMPEAEVVVVAEGFGADWLRRNSVATKNLRLLPLQPAERVSEVLASADVLIALLEGDSAGFSVPSKVLTYLAAGRTILASLPAANLAARTIKRSGAGLVTEPGDFAGFVAAARSLLEDSAVRQAASAAGRNYAESTFDIEAIADRFEIIIRQVSSADTSRSLHELGPEGRV